MVARMSACHVSLVTVLTAFCVASNYALIGLPNFKIMDFIVFVGGFCFGAFAGALMGVLTWVVYGVINPYGFVPQVWLATMFSESIYGLIGGLLGKNFTQVGSNGQLFRQSVFFGTLGFILTFVYDLITNLVYASAFGIPVIAALVFGTPFCVLHQLSNTVIFGVCSIPLITSVRKIVGGGGIGFPAK